MRVYGGVPQVNLEGGRATEERPSVGYPSISFGVEDFEEAFKSMVNAISQPSLLLHNKCTSCLKDEHNPLDMVKPA